MKAGGVSYFSIHLNLRLIFMYRGQIGSFVVPLLKNVKREITQILEKRVTEKKQKLQTYIHRSNRSITEVKIFYPLDNFP